MVRHDVKKGVLHLRFLVRRETLEVRSKGLERDVLARPAGKVGKRVIDPVVFGNRVAKADGSWVAARAGTALGVT